MEHVSDFFTSVVGDHGLYAVFLLMLVDAVLPAASELALLRPLLPPGEPLTADELATGLDLAAQAPPDRPYVVLNMVSSADGKAAIEGRTTLYSKRWLSSTPSPFGESTCTSGGGA